MADIFSRDGDFLKVNFTIDKEKVRSLSAIRDKKRKLEAEVVRLQEISARLDTWIAEAERLRLPENPTIVPR